MRLLRTKDAANRVDYLFIYQMQEDYIELSLYYELTIFLHARVFFSWLPAIRFAANEV